ncbi:MAG TPA: C40 family peptidase [Pseudonocardiaceae bacterium]
MSGFGAAIEAQLRRLGEDGGAGTTAQETSLDRARVALAEVHDRHTAATRAALAGWHGSGAGEANSRATALHTTLTTVSGNAEAAVAILREATGRVGAGRTEVRAMLDEFERWAQGQVAVLRAAPEPLRAAIGANIWEQADAAAARAGEVVTRVTDELSGLAARLRGQQDTGPGAGGPLDSMGISLTDVPVSTVAAGAGGTATLAPPLGIPEAPGSGAPGGGTGGHGGGGGPGGGFGGGGGGGGGVPMGPNLGSVTPIPPGMGVQLGLPGGGTAEAPNEIAANAVRYALQQLGVPYVWGASSPGQGFDCSGLTSWAYSMAGLEIPRHSAAQAVGASVPPDQLMPGDLVVWQGHVAMIIGDGMMVEAGDPVQINPTRTSNIGMPFMGFYRPTGP